MKSHNYDESMRHQVIRYILFRLLEKKKMKNWVLIYCPYNSHKSYFRQAIYISFPYTHPVCEM